MLLPSRFLFKLNNFLAQWSSSSKKNILRAVDSCVLTLTAISYLCTNLRSNNSITLENYLMVIFIIILTCIISIMAFNNSSIVSKYQFSAYRIVHHKEWYRILSHALLHGSWMHLIVNMLVLYSFGGFLIMAFGQFFTFMNPHLLFLFFYVFATAIASLYSLRKHRNNYYYSALGASGAVSAVVFASIFFAPYQPILFFAVIPMPGILFGAGYLWYSYYMSKRGDDNIGHDAHFYGAVFGFLFPIILDPQLIIYFVNQIGRASCRERV